MNKKLNAFLRILTVVAAVAAAVFAFLLKGKMDAALTKPSRDRAAAVLGGGAQFPRAVGRNLQ